MSVGVLQNLTYVIEVVIHTNDKTSNIAHCVAKARISDVLQKKPQNRLEKDVVAAGES
jgi:hypothetical protein